jgi:type II secretory pathway pseudopilin PulG
MNIGNKMKTQKGTSLLEVMLTLAVVGFGILGILYLQGDLSSGSAANKQKAEAIKLAEGKIEDIRNYYRYANDGSTTTVFSGNLQANYDYAEADACADDAPGEPTIVAPFTKLRSDTFQGENACYRITSALGYAATENTIDAYVIASWTNRRNELQEVKASTSISFNPAQLVASTLFPDDSTEAIVPAKGIALLGEGDLGDYNVTETPVLNDDGTYTAITDDGDVLLVDGNTPQSPVLLMIPADTCTQFGVNCSFVTLNGRVYIDTLSQNQLTASQVAIRSSDTTYCVKSGENQTANSQYIYFDYTCYASFGWHGNIGILLEGGNKQNDKFCMGDPTSTGEPDEWNPPVIGARRIYRGMYYAGCTPGDTEDPLLNDTNNGITCSPGNFPVPDPAPEGYVPPPNNVYTKNGIPLYWSVGVNGGVDLGVPRTELPTHDFVISSMSKDKTDGTYCVTEGVMTRDPDSQVGDTLGDLFFGMNDDFFCLNEYVDESYACSLNSGCYIPPTCPFDPSDPPIERHLITGLSGDSDIPLYTSDGFEYCVYTSGGSYECEVYDWGNGWTGYIGVYLPPADAAVLPGDPPVPASNHLGNTVCEFDRVFYSQLDDSVPGPAFNCTAGSSSVVRGTINILNNKNLTDFTITQERLLPDGTTDGDEGTCVVDESNSLFSCVTADLKGDENWAIKLNLATNGYVCNATDDVITLTGIDKSVPDFTFEYEDINTLQITIAGSAAGCP